MNPKKEIERHRLPCGPMTVHINGVCRRKLKDSHDSLLDRLAKLLEDEHDILKEQKDPSEAKKAVDKAEKELDSFMSEWDKGDEPEETMAEKKKRLIAEGKMKAEVKQKVKEYEEQLMGNSKLLADPKQKITTRNKR